VFLLTELSRFLLPTLLAGLISWLVCSVVRRLALARGLVPTPRKRDSHQKPVPRLGGVGMIFAFIIVLLLTQLLLPHVLWFTTELRLSLDRQVLGIMLGALVLLGFGIIDDIKGLSPSWQLTGHVLAALCVVVAGIGIEFITNPFGGPGAVMYLTDPTWNIGQLFGYMVTITPWSDILTICWLVLMMNVMNWFDGLDGLAGGVSLIAAVMLSILSLLVGSPTGTVAMLLVLAGAIGGFLVWNWHPAKLFMGTSGSTLLGFVLGVAAVISGGKLATTFIVLGVPIIDAIWVIISRVRAGRSAWVADRSHLHHRLLGVGLSVPQTVWVMYLLAIVFGSLALWRNSTVTKIILTLVLVGLFGILNRYLIRKTDHA
jgi:UDP-GlcNAc:undecaprenyl-phosphate GlcNAc-1-phosphate transferase